MNSSRPYGDGGDPNREGPWDQGSSDPYGQDPYADSYGQSDYGRYDDEQYPEDYPDHGEPRRSHAVAAPANSSGDSGSNKSGLLMGLIGGVVAALVIVGGFFFFTGNDGEEDAAAQAANTSEATSEETSEEATETTSEAPSTVTETVSASAEATTSPTYEPGEWGYGLDVHEECAAPSGIRFAASGFSGTSCWFVQNIADVLVGKSISEAPLEFLAYDDVIDDLSEVTCESIEDGDGASLFKCTTSLGDIAYVSPR